MESFTRADRLAVWIFRRTAATSPPVKWFVNAWVTGPTPSTGYRFPRAPGSSGLMSTLDGTSWTVAAGMHRAATDVRTVSLIGQTRLVTATLPDTAVYSSEGGVTSEWTDQDFSPRNAAGYWATSGFEVFDVASRVAVNLYSGPSVSFEWPLGTNDGDLAVAFGWCWTTPGAIPLAGAGWNSSGSVSGLSLGFQPFWKVVPEGEGNPLRTGVYLLPQRLS